jgi:cell division protein FtsW (lipid II flippase)
MKERKIDKFFLTVVLLLIAWGVAMFVSASLGILVKNEKTFYSVLFSQLVLGLTLGFIGMFFCLKINYKFWRKYAFFIFISYG